MCRRDGVQGEPTVLAPAQKPPGRSLIRPSCVRVAELTVDKLLPAEPGPRSARSDELRQRGRGCLRCGSGKAVTTAERPECCSLSSMTSPNDPLSQVRLGLLVAAKTQIPVPVNTAVASRGEKLLGPVSGGSPCQVPAG